MACTTVSTDIGFPYNYLFLIFINSEFALPIPFILILIYKTRVSLERQKENMNEKTYLMHKDLLKILIFQLIIPGATLFIPFTITVALTIFDVNSVAVVFQVTHLLGTLHSTLNTIMMLYFIKPYRLRFTQNLWYIPKRLFAKKYMINDAALQVKKTNEMQSVVDQIQHS